MPNAAMSTNVGGMGAHWTAACPRPVDDEVPDCVDPVVLDDALSRAEELLAVTTHAFDRAPMTGAVQRVLGELFDAPARRPVGPMPVAVTVEDDGTLHWTGPAIIARTCGDARTSRCVPAHSPDESCIEGGRARASRSSTSPPVTAEIIRARAVVVAADAFRTPQLLHASGSGRTRWVAT